MRSRITASRISALTITAALAASAGCAAEDEVLGDDDVATESAALSAAVNLGLHVTKENQGCNFGISTYELTAHATGSPSITWYAKDWDGSYFPVDTGTTYTFKGTAPRKYFKVTACVASGCDVEMYSFIPECKPAD